MKSPTKAVFVLAIVGLGIGGTPAAFADGRHSTPRFGVHGRAPVVAHGHRGNARWGLYLGVPLLLSSAYWGPRYFHRERYYPPYYAKVIAVPSPPVTYIEQAPAESTAATPALQSGYWYYCGESKAYYPYVRECPAGWQRVPPLPPAD